MKLHRRDFLTGSGALASYAVLQEAAAAFGVGKMGRAEGPLGGGQGLRLPAASMPSTDSSIEPQ